MASFLPSYFQKRLLRYALSSLNFIDSDALNLDNLGLTLGQRSVIDVKDVPIKVSKLVEAINLPPNLEIRTASIKSLRLTIPADLHASGIKAEIDGIDIDAHLSSESPAHHKAYSKSRPHGPPRHGDRANRPRLSSPPVHDPGGVPLTDQRHDNATDLSSSLCRSRVLPTSEDLAASFLQSEPLEERQELEAAIGSHSHMLDSTTSSAGADDTGLGVPAGFTLPAFVATFFQGIADRLAVRVRDVSVGVDMSIGQAQAEDSMRLVLKVGMIDVDALSSAPPGEAALPSTRTISVHDVRAGLEAGDDLWSQSSSPKLGRPSSQFSVSSTLDNTASFQSSTTHSRAASPQSGRTTSLSSGRDSLLYSATFEPTVGLGIEHGLEDNAQLTVDDTDLASSHSAAPSATSLDQYETEGQSSTDEASQPAGSASSTPPGPSRSVHHVRELSESTLFSHEEAQSIYMSVTSQKMTHLSRSRAMPGGWDWSDGALEYEDPGARRAKEGSTGAVVDQDVAATSADPLRPADFGTIPVPVVDRLSTTEPPMSPTDTTDRPPQQPFVQVLNLDSARITIPDRVDSPPSQHGPDHLSLVANYPSQPRPRAPNPQAHRAQESAPICLQLGDLTLDLDLRVFRLLIRMVQTSIKALPSSLDAEPAKSSPASSSPSFNLDVSKISVNYRDNFRPNHRKETSSYPDSPILCLSLLSLQCKSESLSRRSLTVSKISVAHGQQPVLWFIDSVGVRDSIASSSMLRPHDLAVSISDRVEIQIKPVYIVVDLIRVDDVLSRSGGLSSLLDLGNSIMSTGTLTASSSKPSKQRSTTRSVHFNAPERRAKADHNTNAPGYKVNLRLSGSIIDLVGSEASIKVKSSSLKLALRSGSTRIVIDGAAVEGPILPTSSSPPSVFAKLKGLEVQYSEIPKEPDLDRLITLITPSSDKFDQDDDIMVDTLLRQRRKGAVLDLSIKDMQLGAQGLDWHRHFLRFSDELAGLSTVAKYLPEDDRPGILTFILIQKLDAQLHADDEFGLLNLRSDLIEGAYINVPSLAAAKIDTWSLRRSKDDVLLGEVLPQEMGAPMVMCRFIADEMEPTVRLKLTNCCLEYKLPTVIAISRLLDRINQKYPAPADTQSPRRLSPTSSNISDNPGLGRKIKIMVTFRHSAAALHPYGSPAKGLFLLTDVLLTYGDQRKGPKITIELKKAALLITNNAEVLGTNKNVDHKLYFDQNDQIQELAKSGFVLVATISAALAVVTISPSNRDQEQRQVDVEIKKNLLILETCADSTQTMIQILSSLAPPAPPSTVAKYRTEIVPIQDMLASFTGNAFVSEPGPEVGLQFSHLTASTVRVSRNREDEDEEDDDVGYMKDMYTEDDDDDGAAMTESDVGSEAALSTGSESLHIAPVELYAPDLDKMSQSMMAHSMLDFRSEHFNPKTTVGGTAHRWDSAKGTYGLGSETAFHKSPLKVRVRDMHVIWNMFDGYDWQSTRDTISQVVKDIETRAIHARFRARPASQSEEGDEESVIGDVLFNSIYISIPAKQDPADLTRAINHDIDDQVSETSYATRTTVTASPSRRQSYRRGSTLRLGRSKQHKMSIELQGISVDMVVFPSGSGEVESSVDIRVNKLDIFDHVPTSTWKKFATYMHDAGEREADTSQVHIELLNVRPVQDLSAIEMVLKLTVLPLRLHVDQDALDFFSRFFEFKDESATPDQPANPPYLQRVEVNPIRVRLDYKPKTVDYASLRSGRTTEFMNFIVLDRADMVLRRTILYGVSGFERMGLMLNNIWMPDVKRNQLPGVLAGLAPIRPVVDVARGVNELIAVPIREYRKDGRIVRALQKGAIAFAKTTSTELANLGAKLAIGTQNVLQNAEDLLSPVSPVQQHGDRDEERKQLSLYADQPVGIVQGLRGAYASLERDLLLARDAIVAVPGEVMAQPSATGAAKAILKQSPTIILRPAMGVSKATAQTLQGVANTLDRNNLRRLEDKYKRY